MDKFIVGLIILAAIVIHELSKLRSQQEELTREMFLARYLKSKEYRNLVAEGQRVYGSVNPNHPWEDVFDVPPGTLLEVLKKVDERAHEEFKKNFFADTIAFCTDDPFSEEFRRKHGLGTYSPV